MGFDIDKYKAISTERAAKVCQEMFHPSPAVTQWCQLPKGHTGPHKA